MHTEKDIKELIKFNRWVKDLFGVREPFYSTLSIPDGPHKLLINRGTMEMHFPDDGSYRLYDLSSGMKVAVFVGRASLQQVLLYGLQWATQKRFVSTYT